MQIPQLGQKKQNVYRTASTESSPKKKWLIGGGIATLLIALLLVLTGGNETPGALPMKQAVQNTSDALAIVDKYSRNLQSSQTKNNAALMQALLRGNFQNLNSLYTTTYKPKKRLPATPRLDTKSQVTLDDAYRSNLLDSAIITALKPKISQAQASLAEAKPFFTKQDSIAKIESAQRDLSSIANLLEQPQ